MNTSIRYISGCLFTGMIMARAFGAAPTAGDDKGTTATVWRVGPKTVRLGYDGTTKPVIGQHTGDYAWVKTPEAVFEAAKRTLRGNPKGWAVNNMKPFDGKNFRVVALSDRRQNSLVCLAQKKQWVRLNEKAGIPYINKLVHGHPGSNFIDSSLRDQAFFLQDVAYFYKGPTRYVLSKEFWHDVGSNEGLLSEFLGGVENNPKELKRLCFDPKISIKGTQVQVVFNAMSKDGAVEQWTIIGSQIHKFLIHEIFVEIVRPRGTFQCAVVG